MKFLKILILIFAICIYSFPAISQVDRDIRIGLDVGTFKERRPSDPKTESHTHSNAEHDKRRKHSSSTSGRHHNNRRKPIKDPYKGFNRKMPDDYVLKAPNSKFMLKNGALYKDLANKKVKGEANENVKEVALDLLKEADAMYKKNPKEAEKLHSTAKEMANFLIGLTPVGIATDMIVLLEIIPLLTKRLATGKEVLPS